MALSTDCTDCTDCTGGTPPMAGLDLTSYEGALEAVVAGEPAASALYTLQAAGGHALQLSDADLETLKTWITAGVP